MERCPECGKELPHDSHTCPECGLTLPQTDYTQISDQTIPGQGPPGADEQALSTGSVLGGRYEILGVLGKGGMGWVYRARDKEIDRIVALKVIRQDLARDETIIKRFKDEIILARKVTHKNVLRIYDIAEAEGLRFISMPYIEGKDLKSIIEERGALDINETLRISRQVLEALKSAHEAGVIHRDLKPQNIMIDKDGTVCVADFGIAKSADAGGLTVTGQIVGTPEYMSPEQAEGREVDYRSDLYSFGLVLYEMLTGHVPFKADSIISTLMLRLREQPKAPSVVNPKIPKWLDRLTMRSIERNVDDRYASADEILADIESQTVKLRPKLTRKVLIPIVVGAIAVAAVIFFVGRRPKIVLEEGRTYLAVLPFENMTGDPELDWLAYGIPDNLTADLGQSNFFRVMSFDRLRQAAADMGSELTAMSTPEVMSMLAKATELDAVASGSYLKVGDLIRITLKIEDPDGQAVIGSRIVQDTESALLDMIDRLTLETKQIFNLSQEEIAEDLDRAVGLQRTKSVTAARNFTKGMEYVYAGSYLEAAQAFEAATEADQDFAMAYAKASEAYKNLGYDAKAESLSFIAVDKVVKLIDRVPQVDRTFILANHGDVTYNAEYAIESYEEFIERYPDNPEGYYRLGLTYEAISEWDLAIENLTRALRLDPKFGSARFELAIVLIKKDDLDNALEELDKALSFYQNIGNREGEAGVLNAIGVVHKRRNEFEQATARFEASIKIKEELGDKRGVAASLGNLGSVYDLMGRREEALEVLERSLEIKREIGDKRGISTALNKIGLVYQSYGKYEEALTYYERSYETRKELGDKDLMASSLSDMGTIYSFLGQYDKALHVDSMALAIAIDIGDARGESQSLRNIAETMITRGLFDEASSNLLRALAIDSEIQDVRLLALDNLTLGGHCLERGRVDSAIAYLEQALDVHESVDAQPSIAYTTGLLAEAYLAKGHYLDALRNAQRSLEIADSIDEREQVLDATLVRAKVFQELGYSPGCDSAFQILNAQDEAGLSFQTRCRLRLAKACRLCAADDLGEANTCGEELIAMAGNEYVRCRVQGRLLTGKVAADEGRDDEARRILGAVTREARRYSLRDIEAESLWRLAAVVSKMGNQDEALGLCNNAMDLISNLGLAAYGCLITCVEIHLATGDKAGAASMLARALEVAASTYANGCPPRLYTYYLEQKRIPHYVNLADELGLPTDEIAPAPDYRALFGLN
jgi:tetratricopeptide (TPR) repeat protein/predicted Ser/Thr protein kinase